MVLKDRNVLFKGDQMTTSFMIGIFLLFTIGVGGNYAYGKAMNENRPIEEEWFLAFIIAVLGNGMFLLFAAMLQDDIAGLPSGTTSTSLTAQWVAIMALIGIVTGFVGEDIGSGLRKAVTWVRTSTSNRWRTYQENKVKAKAEQERRDRDILNWPDHKVTSVVNAGLVRVNNAASGDKDFWKPLMIYFKVLVTANNNELSRLLKQRTILKDRIAELKKTTLVVDGANFKSNRQ